MFTGNKGYKRNRNGRQPQTALSVEKDRELLKNIDDKSPVIQAFWLYAKELDDKHDRYERIVKISRDITIESKRIIFLLHNVDQESKRDAVLNEAEIRLQNLVADHFKNIAKELNGQDAFQYIRAYTCGLQEFIEALTFYQYLKTNTIEHWTNIGKQFTYAIEQPNDTCEKIQLKTPLPAVEYMLGLLDLTGELMRKCINNLGSGNIDDCFQICNFGKVLYKGFLSIGCTQSCKEMGRKLWVLKQSLYKMETVCYNITVRGNEMPKHMLTAVVTSTEIPYTDDHYEQF